VRKVLGNGTTTDATSAGAATEERADVAEREPRSWYADLARSDRGVLLPTLGNVFMILSNHEDWQGVIAQYDFAGRVVKRRAPPFPDAEIGEWSDMDGLRCELWMSQKFGLVVRPDIVMRAVLLEADKHHFHDVREYLEGLVHDGVPRVQKWPVTYLHATDSEYIRLAGMKWMVAAVARVMKPGCKVDNVLILEGGQG